MIDSVAGLPSPSAARPTVWQDLLHRWFTADLRSLAAMRIGTAAVVLFDLWDRAQHLAAHYTDAGVLPRAILFAERENWTDLLSFHLLGGSFEFQALLFFITGAVALLLLMGFRTRLMTIAAFVLVVSLHVRNPFVVFGGDFVLKMVLFWGMFLPWGEVFSLDRRLAARRGAPPPPLQVTSTGIAAAMIQIGIIYLFTALLKSGASWRSDFTAIYWALSLEDHVGPLGPFLYAHPGMMKALTAFSILIEASAPLLLFSPVKTRLTRMIALAGLTALHLGILTTMRVGFFPVISIVSLLVFLPSEAWGSARRPAPQPDGAVASPHRSGLLADLRTLAPVLLIGYVLAWNIGMPAPLRWPGRILKIYQSWDMFAPTPLTHDGWWVFVGTLADGRQIDLMLDGAPVQWEARSKLLRGERVRKFHQRLLEKRGTEQLRGFTAYLCRSWDSAKAGGERLVRVEPVFVLQRNLSDYQRGPAIRRPLDPLDCESGPPDTGSAHARQDG